MAPVVAPLARRRAPSVSAAFVLGSACLFALFAARATSPSFAVGTLRGVAARQPSVAREAKVDEIVEELKTLTLLEASELVKAIEETFDVDASASGGAVMMAAPAAAEEEAAPEKTEFDLILKEVPKEKKIAVIKAVRAITGLGLKEAKGICDNLGKFVEGKPKEYCEDAKKQLEEAGAVVELE
eukprot:TRINITY_DN96474_c0_g1_i1.p1 TRINITY_DN96474_c0_g1~~TRINITY_DN96474_c0_g1_i1.p1  ORF type:complete len:214 (+),score=70.02 TRINITY_DN96474_c0_g1_i1:91-642(+)